MLSSLRVASFYIRSFLDCYDCGNSAERRDQYMLNDDIWHKITDKNPAKYLCWDCMKKRVENILKRDLTGGDFKKNPYSQGNPEVRKLKNFTPGKKHTIYYGIYEDDSGKFVFHGNVLETDSLKTFNEVIKPNAQKEPLFDYSKKWLKEMKEKFPDAEIKQDGLSIP